MSKQKTEITRKVTITASQEKVWEALADFGNVQRLSPNIAKSYLTSDLKNGVGATRHCDFTMMGAQVEEKIVEWDEGNSIKIQLYEPKNLPLVIDMEAFFELKEKGDTTELTATFSYGMKNGLGRIMNNLTMKKMNEKSWVSFMAGIKYSVETGNDVNKETNLELASVQS